MVLRSLWSIRCDVNQMAKSRPVTGLNFKSGHWKQLFQRCFWIDCWKFYSEKVPPRIALCELYFLGEMFLTKLRRKFERGAEDKAVCLHLAFDCIGPDFARVQRRSRWLNCVLVLTLHTLAMVNVAPWPRQQYLWMQTMSSLHVIVCLFGRHSNEQMFLEALFMSQDIRCVRIMTPRLCVEKVLCLEPVNISKEQSASVVRQFDLKDTSHGETTRRHLGSHAKYRSWLTRKAD